MTTENELVLERFTVHATIDCPGKNPHGLAFDGEHLWASDTGDNRVSKINPDTGQVLLTIPFDGDVAGTAWDGEALWQADNRTKTLSRINPETGEISLVVECDTEGGVLGGLCFDGTDLWLIITGAGQLRRIRTSDGAILKVHAIRNNGLGLGFDGRRIWYSDIDDGRVRKVDPATGTELMSYGLTSAPSGLAFANDRLYFSDSATGKIHAVSLNTRR